MTIDADVLRLIASQFVSKRMKGYVNYENLITFLNEALRSRKAMDKTEDPIGVRVDLPAALLHVMTLLPERDQLPKAPLFLKVSSSFKGRESSQNLGTALIWGDNLIGGER